MRKAILLSGLGMALGLLSTTAAAQDYGYGYGDRGGIVRCESSDGRWRQCPVDTRGGVDLVRQLSNASCIRGRNWGDDARGIWVNDGCRGEFRVGDGGYGYDDGYRGGWRDGGRAFRCESAHGRGRQCAVDVRGRVQLVRQLSDAACIEGRTWGQDGRGVWVDDGCRAEFQVAAGRSGNWSRWRGRDRRYGYGDGYGDGYGGGDGQSLRCESNDGRGRRCGADIRRGAQMQRQLSASPCIEGRSWGWDRGGVWVDHGCRADFAVW